MDPWSIVIGALIGVVTGVAASFIFLFIISRLKPKIDISPVIAKGDPVNGHIRYRIKVINRTRHNGFINRTGCITNVRAKLELVNIYHIHHNRPKDRLLSGEEINLIKDETFELGRLDKKDERETYAFRFMTEVDLENKWTDTNTQFLRFRISATDALSNFGAVFSKSYEQDKLQVFREGNFEVGDTFEVYKPHQSST